jgi:hypothetical protein
LFAFRKTGNEPAPDHVPPARHRSPPKEKARSRCPALNFYSLLLGYQLRQGKWDITRRFIFPSESVS